MLGEIKYTLPSKEIDDLEVPNTDKRRNIKSEATAPTLHSESVNE